MYPPCYWMCQREMGEAGQSSAGKRDSPKTLAKINLVMNNVRVCMGLQEICYGGEWARV